MIVGTLLALAMGSFVPGPPVDLTLTMADVFACRTSCTSNDGSGRIYLDEFSRQPDVVRDVLFHEMGHQYDYAELTDADRAAFEQITRDSRPWRSPPDSPNEQFAEAYRVCSEFRHPRGQQLWGAYGYSPTRRQSAAICALIRKAAIPMDRSDG